ncbi:MAG: hypothetical protein MJZ14_07830 [Paludibacteraceae bacterium]|nr:hypothetical protein [Paludibacteraceae bacterium]
MDEFKELIRKAVAWIKNVVKRIINGVLNFFSHVVSWFRSLKLNPQTDIPFVINAKDPQFREMLKNAPMKDVGLFKGVYNEQTETITHHEYIAADSCDAQTNQVIGNEALVVLK